jgi:methylglyoxal synthase
MHRRRIALIAHDARKPLLVDWVGRHLALLEPHALIATGTTGSRLLERFPQLDVLRVRSGPLGGDQQIGAMIAEGALDALVFFPDPLTAVPHDVDVKALTRLALVYDLPMACNPATADALVRSGLFGSVVTVRDAHND